MTVTDMPLFTNIEKVPVITAMTCAVGQYALPGSDCLGESLVLHENGGAAALWAPTGFSINKLAKILNEEFYHALVYDKSKKRLGDLVLHSLKAYRARKDEAFMLHIYNIIGDPALKLK